MRCQLPPYVQPCTLTDVSISGTSTLLVTGYDSARNGFLLRSIDGGSGWINYPLSGCRIPAHLHRVTSSGQHDTFFLIDQNGTVYRSDNQIAWRLQGRLPAGYWNNLWFSDLSHGWAIGSDGETWMGTQRNLIYKTTDGGSNWIPDLITHEIPLWLNDISGWPGKFAVVVGPTYLILRRDLT